MGHEGHREITQLESASIRTIEELCIIIFHQVAAKVNEAIRVSIIFTVCYVTFGVVLTSVGR